MSVKVLLCPLVSDDYERAVRAIKSSFNQYQHNLLYGVHVVINSLDQNFIKNVVEFCELNNVRYSVTESDGTPSTGKNSVFEVFHNSEFTHMSQLDGDDFFYPTFLNQVEHHLTRYPNTDVLATIPLDLLAPNYQDRFVLLEKGFYASVWGTHYADMYTWCGKVGRDCIVDGISNPNYARFVLYSKKVTEKGFKYDKEIIVGEDKKIHYDFLAAHQKFELSYWFTMASDMWICDRMSDGIQKKHSGIGDMIIDDVATTKKIQDYVEKILEPDRSGPGIIPIDYPPMFLDFEAKINFLNDFLR